MAFQQITLLGGIVKKSNALARARWSAESVWEPRLVALLASKVRADDTDFQVYEIPVTELIGLSEKNPSGRTYKELATIVDRVMSRVITVNDGEKGGWIKYNVFSRCRYNPEKGTLELRFDPDLKPHYLNLQRNFAQYKLLEYLMLPSIYSQRIFEILKSWSDRSEIIISIDELHDMLGTPDSLRRKFPDFRRRVLEKAHKDILKTTTLLYEWQPVKQGRAFVAIRFTFSDGKRAVMLKEKLLRERWRRNAKSNASFVKAVDCVKKKGGICRDQDNKRKVCDVCQVLNLIGEFRGKRPPPDPPRQAKLFP
jgi:plasmid replication initiation protein